MIEAPSLPASRPRILVVEDERIVARALKTLLEAMGYDVPALASSGEAAVRLATEQMPDLILMDISLDGPMDGVEAARLVRARHRMPVVFLTAYGNQEIVERAKVIEPFGYVIKPYEERELSIVIEMALYRHRMDRKLMERERLLAATLHSIGDAVIATDSGGRVSFMNPVAERLTGWTLPEASGLPAKEVFRIVAEDGLRPMESPLSLAMRDRAVVPLANHTALIRRDSTRLPIDDAASPILDDAGSLLGGVLVFRDMTERRAAMRAMSKLAAIVASSEDAILSTTAEGEIVTWNAAAERLYGYSASEAIGRHATMLAPADRLGELRAALGRAGRGENVPAWETARLCKDGHTVGVAAALSPLRDEEGRVAGIAEIARDLTHLRRLEEQFRQAQKMEAIGRLAGGIAHDFNNLLTIINGYASLALAGMAQDDPRREMLELVGQAGDRAAALTSQLLAYSRKQILKPVVLDLADLVRGAERMLRPMLEADIEVRLVAAPGPCLAKADPAHLEQAIINLAINARDAMPKGGVLTLETGRATVEEGGTRQARCVLAVSDTGTGMDEATLSRLFEPFFTTKEVGKGTGLGLAMVFGTVKQSGGAIEVESKPGRGTRFRILLPAIEEARQQETRPAFGAMPGGTETVLLVEDEEGVRLLTALLLRRLGYTVLEAANADAADAVLARHQERIDLLVSDVVLPDRSGPEVAATAQAAHPAVKVLFQSGYPEPRGFQAPGLPREDIEAARAAFIQKPFTLAEMARKVRDVLDGKQAG